MQSIETLPPNPAEDLAAHASVAEDIDLVAASIDGLSGLPEDQQTAEERQILEFVQSLEHREEVVATFHHWLDLALERNGGSYGELEAFVAEHPLPTETEPLQEKLNPAEVVPSLEKQHYVTRPIRFADMVHDESRAKSSFLYDKQSWSNDVTERGRELYPMSELRGLRELNDFLGKFIQVAAKRTQDFNFKNGLATAKSLQENLTFIGDQELKEGCAGLAALWKDYLERDPNNQLCIISSVANLPAYKESGSKKSDTFVRDRILELLGQEDDPEGFMDRITQDPRQLTADPEHVRIVIVDDWTVSGQQMRKVCEQLLPKLRKARPDYSGSLEVNLIAAPKSAIENGLEVEIAGATETVPVRAYFMAYEAKPGDSENVGSHITGTHATVNFGFAPQVHRMTAMLNDPRVKAPGQRPRPVPALSSVYRSYWPKASEVSALSSSS